MWHSHEHLAHQWMHQLMILLKPWNVGHHGAAPAALDVWLPDQDSPALTLCCFPRGLVLRLSEQLCLQGLPQTVVQSTQGSKDQDCVTPQPGAAP